MADVKYNKRHIFGDDDFKVTAGDLDFPGKHFGLQHDTSNVKELVGFGSKLVDHKDPVIMADDGYFDLPADSAGHGFFFLGDGTGYAEIIWDTANTVTLISNTTNVDDADTDTYFCIFDNTSSVRVKNRLGSSVRVMFEYQYTETPMAPTFKAFSVPSGVDNLDASLTINSLTSTPTIRYKGGDADGTDIDAWTYGDALTYQSGTAPDFNCGSPGLGSNDDGVCFNGGAYYSKADYGHITTEDWVIEAVVKITGSTEVFAGDWVSGNAGWIFWEQASSPKVRVRGAGAEVDVVGPASTGGAWYHIIAFGNVDENSTNGAVVYVNGVAGTGVNISTVGDMTNTNALALGALNTGALPSNGTLAYLAMWKRANWHQAGVYGPAEWSNIAVERFAKFTGVYPQVFTNAGSTIINDGDMEAVGTTSWSASDATLSKDTTAPLYEGTQHLRITSTNNTFYAYQSILVAGNKYRITGAARSVSGSSTPRIMDNTSQVWIGTTSTDWQEFDETFVATGSTIYLGSGSAHPGVVDYDDVVISPADGLPITRVRAYSAYLDKVEGDYRKLYYVGSNWLRMCHWVDSNAESVRGYLAETQVENIVQVSEDFSSWAKIEPGTVVTDNAVVCPDGRTAAASIAGDSDDEQHGVSLDRTLTAATHAFSVYAKPGTDATYGKDWIRLQDSAVAGCYCDFDIANGIVGTASIGCTGYIEGPFYNNFYRCCIVFTGFAGVNTLRIQPIDADTDSTFVGDGSTPNIWIWGAQCELSDYMTSLVITSGSKATRLKDELRYVGLSNLGGAGAIEGAVAMDILFPSYDNSISKQLLEYSESGSGADNLLLYASTSSGSLSCVTAATGGNAGSSTLVSNMVDGQKHSIRSIYETDNLRVSADGVTSTADTSVDLADNQNRIYMGMRIYHTLQPNCLMSKFRIYSLPTTKG